MSEAIVLAGGLGTRLGALSENVPKPMLDINERPFLEYILDYLIEQGVERVILSVGHLHHVVMDHFGDSYKQLRVDYAIEASPLGTGGAIRLALDEAQEERVFVINGDTLFKPNLAVMSEVHRAHSATMTMALRPINDAGRYGAVSLSEGQVTSMAEKGVTGPGLINGGIYLLEKECFLNAMQPGRVLSFERDVIPQLVGEGRVLGYVAEHAYFIDIGIPEDYRRAQRELATPFTG